MANPNPYKARLAKRRKDRKRRNPGKLADARTMLWDSLEALADRLALLMEASGENPADVGELYKIVQAQATAINSYAKLVEVGEVEERLEEVTSRLAQLERETRPSRISA